jgi:PIN domain
MEFFHVVIDTSMLRQMHFQHADFERLLLRSRKGLLKIYIPHIVLEEERTYLLAKLVEYVQGMRGTLAKVTEGLLAMLAQGLPAPILDIWTKEELARNSREVFDKFVGDNKIEVLAISEAHTANAWKRYFDCAPPFNPEQRREVRRQDIPDSWILEAALDLKPKQGRLCALVADSKLRTALKDQGFETYNDVESLIEAAEAANAATPIRPLAPAAQVLLDQLRSNAFKDVDLIVLGMNEVLRSPSKDKLFEALERAGIDRAIAEHEARTLVLSGVLKDTGHHLIPTNPAQAAQAADTLAVQDILLRGL